MPIYRNVHANLTRYAYNKKKKLENIVFLIEVFILANMNFRLECISQTKVGLIHSSRILLLKAKVEEKTPLFSIIIRYLLKALAK